MRVVLKRRNRDERGAVAVMVAVLTTLLCVMAAFVLDFGQAYVNKNQAQEAADAGALAAGKVYMDNPGTCSVLAADPVLEAKALTEARTVSQLDLPGSTSVIDGDPVTCDNGTLKVRYGVKYDSPLGLGQLATTYDHITVQRKATAAFRTNPVGNLRPWMICASQIPAGPYPSNVVEVHLPGNGHFPADPNCPTNHPGSWWRTSCFNGGGSHGDTEQNVLNGCDSIQIVPGQDPTWDSTQLSSYLRLKCGPESVYCLHDDQGRDVTRLTDEWDTLLGETIAMPVFCTTPQCTPSSVTATGNWPIWKIAAVTVCGYAMKGNRSPEALPAGDCQALNTAHRTPLTTFYSNSDLGFLVIFRGIIAAGTPTTFQGTKTSMRLIE